MRFAPILLALSLAACAGIPNPVSQTTVYDLENSYGIIQAQAIAYVSFPLCPHGTSVSQSVARHCSIDTAVVAIGKADRDARAAIDRAESFVRNNPTVSPLKAISEAQNAINLAGQIAANWGVH